MSVFAKTFGFLGCGTLSSAIVTGLCTAPDPSKVPHRIVLSPRNADKAKALQEAHPQTVHIASSNQEVLDQSDVVFLAVRPQVCDGILSELKFNASHIVISLVATANFARIAPLCAPVPVEQIARACPVPAVAERRGVTTAFGHVAAREIFDELGSVVVLEDEGHMDVMMTLGCVMGPFYELQLKVAQWLVNQGVDKKTSASYTAEVYNMFAQDVIGKRHFGLAGIEGLVHEQTPGGLNENNIRSLREKGFYDAHTDVMNATLDKLRGTKKISD